MVDLRSSPLSVAEQVLRMELRGKRWLLGLVSKVASDGVQTVPFLTLMEDGVTVLVQWFGDAVTVEAEVRADIHWAEIFSSSSYESYLLTLDLDGDGAIEKVSELVRGRVA